MLVSVFQAVSSISNLIVVLIYNSFSMSVILFIFIVFILFGQDFVIDAKRLDKSKFHYKIRLKFDI